MCLVLKNVIKRAYYLQPPASWHNTSKAVINGLFWGWGKPECTKENHHKLVRNRQNRVDITKHKCRDMSLPDGMGVPNIQAAQRGWVNGNLPFGYTVSLLVRLIFDGLSKSHLLQKG